MKSIKPFLSFKPLIAGLILLQMISSQDILGQRDFLTMDSSSVTLGIEILDWGDYENSRLCRVKSGDSIIEYTPDEVLTYQFNKGKKYVSKEIPYRDSSRRFFLEVLMENGITLLYLKGKEHNRFFIERNNQLIEIPNVENNPDGFLKTVDPIYPCEIKGDRYKLLPFQKKSVYKFFKRYKRCSFRLPSYNSYGVMFSWQKNQLVSDKTSNYLNYNNFNSVNNYTIGLFVDLPIAAGKFSFYGTLDYTHNEYSSFKEINQTAIDFQIKTGSLNLNPSIKFRMLKTNLTPYLLFGTAYSVSLYTETEAYMLEMYDEDAYLSTLEADVLSAHMVAYSLGAGIQSRFYKETYWFFEIRSDKLYGIQQDTFNKTIFKFNTGIGF